MFNSLKVSNGTCSIAVDFIVQRREIVQGDRLSIGFLVVTLPKDRVA